MNDAPLRGREKADYLVRNYAKHAHVPVRGLDENNDVSFGEFGFHYSPEKEILVGRVYNGRARIKAHPELRSKIRRSLQALNDPKIGGMYDRGGGYFVLDEEKEMFFWLRTSQFGPRAPLNWTRILTICSN